MSGCVLERVRVSMRRVNVQRTHSLPSLFVLSNFLVLHEALNLRYSIYIFTTLSSRPPPSETRRYFEQLRSVAPRTTKVGE